MTLVGTVSAQPSEYDSGFQVANQSSDAANVVIQYVDQTGAVVETTNDTIAGNGSTTYFPIDAAAGFNGSVVISSNQPVAAITNVLGDGFAFGASYEGFTGGAASVALPLTMKDNFGFDTWFNVQNASAPGGSDVSVSIAYEGTTCTEAATIPAGAAATFVQSTNTCLPVGHVGAATVTATGGEVVATVMQTAAAQLLAYNGFTGGSEAPIMPLVQANNFMYFTGIQVQNVGAAATDVTLTYVSSSDPADTCTETMSGIAAGSSATFIDSSCAGLSAADAFVGSASVTANSGGEPLVAIVNQTTFGDKGSAYNGIDPDSATTVVNFPLIMEANFGYFTGFNVFNAGGSSVDVTCTFSGSPSPADVTGTIAAGAALTAVQTGTTPYVGSVTCTADGPVVGVANELGGATGDTFFAYGGFNQ